MKQARQSDDKMEITVGAEKGAASFASIYEYTLFELLPVLRALDPERADRLLQDDRELQSTLHQFPDGLKSLNPQNGTPGSITMRVADTSNDNSATDRYQADLERRTAEVLNQAEKDPKQALATVMSLPDFHNARTRALVNFAQATCTASPTYSREALAELMKMLSSVQPPASQAALLAGAGDTYLRLGDDAGAKKVVEQGMKLAENLYANDTNANDPNQAFKGEWPSVSVWRRFVSLAARISPQAALEAINAIPDPEIQVLQRIALANGLLGISSGPVMMRVNTKKENYATSFAPQ